MINYNLFTAIAVPTIVRVATFSYIFVCQNGGHSLNRNGSSTVVVGVPLFTLIASELIDRF